MGVVGLRAGGALPALRHREFARFWASGLVSSTGSWMQSIAVPFVIDELTHSTAWVGLAVFCTFFPNAACAPIAGALTDRVPRRRLLVSTQLVMMASSIILCALWVTDEATPGLILACVVVSATANSISNISWQASISDLVPLEVVPNALRLHNASFQMARVAGPVLAGLVLATLGASVAFLANALSFAVVLVVVMTLRSRPVVSRSDVGMWRAIADGLAYAREHRSVGTAVWIVFVYGFLGVSVMQLAEPITRRVFEGGSGGYGLIVAMHGIGGLAGASVMLRRGDAVRRSVYVHSGFVICAAGQIILGVTAIYVVGLVMFFAIGTTHVTVLTSCITAVQMESEEAFRGRVVSLYMTAFLAGIPLGALTEGLIADVIGLRVTLVASGVLLGLVALLFVFRCDRLSVIDPPEIPTRPAVSPSPA